MADDEDLKALQETLREAHKAKSTAHIGPVEAGRGADAIQRSIDKAFDADAEKNRTATLAVGSFVAGNPSIKSNYSLTSESEEYTEFEVWVRGTGDAPGAR